jgi:hypothetical protein
MEKRNYLTVEELSERIHYAPRYIREKLMKTVFQEGEHYFYPFGGRRILFVWENIERDMMTPRVSEDFPVIPLSRGGVCHG